MFCSLGYLSFNEQRNATNKDNKLNIYVAAQKSSCIYYIINIKNIYPIEVLIKS